jgi:cytochrome c biogenesis protein CcdA
MKKVFLLVTGFLTCPCHLPFVLPVLAGLLAGTAVGGFIAENTGLLIALATVYFIGVVVYFLRWNTSSGTEQSSESRERLHE